MTGPSSLQGLVDTLQRLGPDDVTVERVLEVLSATRLRDSCWRPYAVWRDDRYARSLVHRDALFDVMVLCWQAGHMTPIHNHDGQLGWVRVLRGRIEETGYRSKSGTGDVDFARVPQDENNVGQGVDLVTTTHLVATPGMVSSVDRERAIHRIANPRRHPDDEPAVTLHVYSHPHDTCLAFDPAARTVWRRQLKFDRTPASAS